MSYWYLAINQKSEGPFAVDEVINRVRAGQVTAQTLAYTQGMSDWTPLGQIPKSHSLFKEIIQSAPPVPTSRTGWKRSHEIDYEIFGDDMQFVEITLDPQETRVAEAGGMMYMSQGIRMEAQFGDGSQERPGFLDKVVAAGKRVLTGESLFTTTFTCVSSARE